MFLGTIVLPFLLAASVDIADISSIFRDGVSVGQEVYLYVTSVLLPLYFFCHWLSLDYEWAMAEDIADIRRKHEADTQTLKASRQVFMFWNDVRSHLGESLRTCIGTYADVLKGLMAESERTGAPVQRGGSPAQLYQQNLKALLRAMHAACPVKSNYLAKPAGKAKIGVLLLRESAGYLTHLLSYDGAEWNCLAEVCEKNKESRFRMDGGGKSAALEAVRSDSVVIIKSCSVSSGDDSSPFYYFADHAGGERDLLKSMVAIPVRLSEQDRYCLCLTSSVDGDFVDKHRDAYLLLQSDFRDRLRLLGLQRQFLEKLWGGDGGGVAD